MPTLPALITFLLTSIVLIVIPGPSVVFAIGRTLSLGRAAGLVSVIANAVGTSLWVVFAAFGLAGLLQVVPELIDIIRILGAAYLAYLGWQTIRGSSKRHAQISSGVDQGKSLKTLFKEGFLVGLGNVKVAVFFTAVLPQFTNPEGDFMIQFLLLGAIFEVLGVIGDSTYVVAAAYVREWLMNKPERIALVVRVGGFMIVALAVWLLIEALA